MKELKDLQISDKVILHSDKQLRVKQVGKVTKNYLRVEGCLYNKDTGRLRGSTGFGFYSYIEPATEERIKEVEETERREMLSRKLFHYIRLGLPLEKLERIMKIVEE